MPRRRGLPTVQRARAAPERQALVDGASRVLEGPGYFLIQQGGLLTGHHVRAGAWALMTLFNLPIYIGLGWAVGRLVPRGRGADRGASGAGTPVRAESPPIDQPSVAAEPSSGPSFPANGAADPGRRGLSRRAFLTSGSRLAAAGVAGGVAYSFVGERFDFAVTRRTIRVADLPRELDGLTVAQLTDLHHGPWTPLSYIRRVIDTTNALRADLIVLTGDYVHESRNYIKPVVAELGRLRPRLPGGVLSVMGNHDWWEDVALTRVELQRWGIRMIDNSRVFLTRDRRIEGAGGVADGLCIAGVGDLWEDQPNVAAALGGVLPGTPRLLLSHNPDMAEWFGFRSSGYRVDLMFSGHTHGGQIWCPGLGTPIIPSIYGQKYARGLVNGPCFPVLISSGLGTTIVPLRFGRPPEIAVVTLRA